MDWCVFFGEKHKPAPTAAAEPIRFNGNGNGSVSLDEIEQIVRTARAARG